MTRVITYTPTAPTNFSDGNAMFNGATQNMRQAFKTGISTADTFGQAIENKDWNLIATAIVMQVRHAIKLSKEEEK